MSCPAFQMQTAKGILIVAPNLAVQDALVQLLRATRVPATGVSTWQEAAQLTCLVRFAVVLCDIERPQDWDCVRQLRQQLPREVPIVALNAYVAADGKLGIPADDLGCAGCVGKPAAATLIMRALTDAAGSRLSEKASASEPNVGIGRRRAPRDH